MTGSHDLEIAGDAMVSSDATFVAAPKGVDSFRENSLGTGSRAREIPAGSDLWPNGICRPHAMNPALSKPLRELPPP